MDSKLQKSTLRSEHMGVQYRNHGRVQLVDHYPKYHHTSSSNSETIDTGSTTYAYTKERTGIETGMVHVTLPFDNLTATPNRIRVKHPDGNISQSTHYALLKRLFLPVEACNVRLFDTIVSFSLLSLGKLCDAGCTAYFNYKSLNLLSGYNFLQGVRSSSTDFLWKLNKDHNYHQEYEEFQ